MILFGRIVADFIEGSFCFSQTVRCIMLLILRIFIDYIENIHFTSKGTMDFCHSCLRIKLAMDATELLDGSISKMTYDWYHLMSIEGTLRRKRFKHSRTIIECTCGVNLERQLLLL